MLVVFFYWRMELWKIAKKNSCRKLGQELSKMSRNLLPGQPCVFPRRWSETERERETETEIIFVKTFGSSQRFSVLFCSCEPYSTRKVEFLFRVMPGAERAVSGSTLAPEVPKTDEIYLFYTAYIHICKDFCMLDVKKFCIPSRTFFH